MKDPLRMAGQLILKIEPLGALFCRGNSTVQRSGECIPEFYKIVLAISFLNRF